jgi:hypothetical protein
LVTTLVKVATYRVDEERGNAKYVHIEGQEAGGAVLARRRGPQRTMLVKIRHEPEDEERGTTGMTLVNVIERGS